MGLKSKYFYQKTNSICGELMAEIFECPVCGKKAKRDEYSKNEVKQKGLELPVDMADNKWCILIDDGKVFVYYHTDKIDSELELGEE